MRNLLILGALAGAAAPAAMAQETVTVTGNMALVSDYQWRNVTQSNQDMTVQGGLDLVASNGFYVGTWASGVDFNNADDTNLEVDVYGGYRFDLGGLGADIGFLYYAYSDSQSADINFYEVYGKLSKTFGNVTVGGSLNWDPDNETVFADASAGVALSPEFTLSAGVGKYLEGAGEYAGWNAGGAYLISGVSLGVRYYDNDFAGDNDNMVFSIGRVF